MSNKKTVLNEMQVRRWGKLAAIKKPLTENWLDALTEEEEGEEEMEMDAEEEPGMRDPAMRDPAMRDKMPAMRDDDEEPGMRDKRPMEGLDLEVIDDEELTEAVLQRVVERLLKRK